MVRFRPFLAAALVMVAAQVAAAAPIQVNFNTEEFAGPDAGTTGTFIKQNAYGTVDFTFEALNELMNPSGTLHWDANDGDGFGDGFGVRGTDGSSYSRDEIEGNERLRLTFSDPVRLTGFLLTDFFNEDELTHGLCAPAGPNCYIETGAFMLTFEDGTSTNWMDFLADSAQHRLLNGLFELNFDFEHVTSIAFMSPGRLQGKYPSPFTELHEFSLAGVKFDSTPVPEPTTMALVGLGLAGLAASRRRRKA